MAQSTRESAHSNILLRRSFSLAMYGCAEKSSGSVVSLRETRAERRCGFSDIQSRPDGSDHQMGLKRTDRKKGVSSHRCPTNCSDSSGMPVYSIGLASLGFSGTSASPCP